MKGTAQYAGRPRRTRITRACGSLSNKGWLILGLMGMQALSLPAQEGEPPSFESDILPIFQQHCLQCHGDQARQAGLSLETLDRVLAGGDSGSVVVAHKPLESRLLVLISSGGMPMGAPPLGAGAIDVVRRWIEAGMPGGTPETPAPAAAPPVREREVMAAILGAKCLPCHGRRRQEAGLDLRTREGLLKGGKSGPAVVPGKPEESLLVRRIRAQEMPPPDLQEQFSVRGLTSVEFEKVQAWIARGASPDPEKPPEAALLQNYQHMKKVIQREKRIENGEDVDEEDEDEVILE